jgi:DNA-binding FadR family transcriptional regulator
LTKTHRGIAEAIEAGDRDLAGDRMGEHLAALSVFMR